MDITVKMDGLAEFQAEIEAWPREAGIATTRAIRGTLKWLQTRTKKEGAVELKVPQKALTRRLVTSRLRNGETSGKLWAGTWNISPFAVGKPSQGKTGVTGIPGRRYKGAFLGSVYGGRDSIWMRSGSKHFDPLLFPGRKSGGGPRSVPTQLRHRFPVAKASIIIDETMAAVFDRDEAAIQAEFNKQLLKELNFELRVKKNR